MNPNILDYYRDHSPITDPGEYANLYENLPDDLHGMIAIIQSQMIHRLAAQQFGVTLTWESRSEQRLRTMQQRLGRIMELDPSPLTMEREPKEKQVGMCRDFAVFLVSILRHKGIPARMRVGFADYLDTKSQFKGDHWITEYWNADQTRWVLADPDVGGVPLGMIPVKDSCNLHDIRRDKEFYVAGSAWKLAREGKVRSDLFRYSGRWKGFPCIRGNLLHDFQSLNKLEMGLFDYFDELHQKPETQMTVEDKAILDKVAELTYDPDANFEELQAYFAELPRTQRIYTKLRQLGVIDDIELASTNELKPSGMEQLAAHTDQIPDTESHATLSVFRTTLSEDDELPLNHPVYTQQSSTPPGLDDIVVRGARQHNLKNITVHIPRHKMVVVTGVSGSGKSSLAFDTIYAEGQRRYVESLSSFARQFMHQMEKPQVDQITGLSPAIAIEQKTISRNPRSTVGTVTEILDYLRVLYARVGTPHCPQCGRAVQPQSAQQITNQLAQLPAGTRFQLMAPIARNRKGTFKTHLKRALKDGYTRARVDGEMVELLEGIPELDKQKKHNIELVIDRLVSPHPSIPSPNGRGGGEGDYRTLLMDSVETSLHAGDGLVLVDLGDEEITLSEDNACPECDISFPKLEPHLFSFNSPLGMCGECNGLGVQLQVDPDMIIANPEISLLDGASRWYGNVRKKKSPWREGQLKVMADYYGADLETPWNELPEDFRHALIFGSGEVKFHFQYDSPDGSWSGQSHRPAQGIVFHINRLFRQTKSEYTRRHYMSFMSQLPCPRCEGERLNAESRFVTIDGKRLPELTSWSIENIHNWVSNLTDNLSGEQLEIGEELIKEIGERIGFLRNVGLHYLTLDRPAPSLSGGEGSASAWPHKLEAVLSE